MDAAATFITQARNEPGDPFPPLPGAPEHAPLAAAGTQVAKPAAGSSLTWALQRKLRENGEAERELTATKADFARRMEEAARREKKLAEKRVEVEESVRRFRAFIVDTDTKRTRALQKAAEEQKQVQKKEETIAELTARLAQLQRRRNALRREWARLQPAQNFLERAVAQTDEFAEIDELVTRYKILRDTNGDLRREAQSVQAAMEATQVELQALLKEKQNEILVKNSDLARLQKTLEEAARRAVACENEVDSAEARARETVAKVGQLAMAVRNLYARVLQSRELLLHQQRRKRSHNPPIEEPVAAPGETPQQRSEAALRFLRLLLDEIGQRTAEMRDIVALGDEARRQQLLAHFRAAQPLHAQPRAAAGAGAGADGDDLDFGPQYVRTAPRGGGGMGAGAGAGAGAGPPRGSEDELSSARSLPSDDSGPPSLARNRTLSPADAQRQLSAPRKPASLLAPAPAPARVAVRVSAADD
jgi:hypothetical protein